MEELDLRLKELSVLADDKLDELRHCESNCLQKDDDEPFFVIFQLFDNDATDLDILGLLSKVSGVSSDILQSPAFKVKPFVNKVEGQDTIRWFIIRDEMLDGDPVLVGCRHRTHSSIALLSGNDLSN
jgi:hypothetical protein